MENEARDLAASLLAGDQRAVLKKLAERQHEPAWKVHHQLVTPALQYIGQLWEENKITVADEHLATAVCDMAMSRFYNWQGGEGYGGKKVMLLCLEGEQHYLGLKMASNVFLEEGWEVRYFGPNLPLEYALQAAAGWKPDVVALSVSIAYHLIKLKAYVNELSSLPDRPLVMVGGRLASLYDLKPYCNEQTVILHDISTLNTWLKTANVQEADNVNS